jgi:serine/threonine protein phosphatase PrpC
MATATRSSEDVGPWHLDLTKDQVRKPLLGSGSAKPVAFRAERPRGTLLVASDGLVKYAPRDRICRLALEKDLPSAGRKIVDLARLRSGQLQDDVSLVLCRLT